MYRFRVSDATLQHLSNTFTEPCEGRETKLAFVLDDNELMAISLCHKADCLGESDEQLLLQFSALIVCDHCKEKAAIGRDALAKSHAELVAALDMFVEVCDAETRNAPLPSSIYGARDNAQAALSTARALVPEAGA